MSDTLAAQPQCTAARDGAIPCPSPQSRDLVPVVFIAGAPRSGSTLLERVLGMHDGLCPVGEAHFVWERSFGENQLCGCASPFHECGFWGEVSRQAFGVAPSMVDYAAAQRLKDAVSWRWNLPWLLLARRPAHQQSQLQTYGELLVRLYGAVLDVSGARIVLDSSKDPRHGLILSRLPGFAVHVVHLVRDPRAVAFSWTRRRKRPEIHWQAEDMPIERITRTAGRWSTHNALVEALAGAAASYSRVRYEDFVAAPDATIARLLSPHAQIGSAPMRVAGAEVTLEPTHTVSGNPMRFKQGPLQITLDDEWRRAMAARDRWSVTSVTWPLLARYGYSLRGRS
jgi:hypothetical protein